MSYLIYDNYDIYQSDSYNIAFCSVNEKVAFRESVDLTDSMLIPSSYQILSLPGFARRIIRLALQTYSDL